MRGPLFRSFAAVLVAAVCVAQQREPIPSAPVEVVTGRVRLRDRTPLVGHPISLMWGSKEVASTVTDEAGRFELPRQVPGEPRRSLVSVLVQPSPDLLIVQPSQFVDAKEKRYDFIAARIAPLHGIAVDALGLPVSFVSLRVFEQGGAKKETCVTDAGGRFTTVTAFPAGSVRVIPLAFVDGDRADVRHATSVQHSVPPPAGPVVCKLVCDRRYALDFVLAPGTDEADYEVQILASGVSPSGAGGAPVRRGSVERGSPPWTRPAARLHSTPLAETLHVLSRDGLAGGSVELIGTSGDAPLPIALRPLGALELVLGFDPTLPRKPHAVSSYARAYFTPLSTGQPFDVGLGAGRTETVRWIEPGRWRVEVAPPYYPTQTFEVEVRPGARSTLSATLGAPLAVGTLRIRVADPDRDVPGWKGLEDAPQLGASVRSTAKGGETFNVLTSSSCGTGVHAWFERVAHDGRLVYEALVENVPHGDYVVSVRSDKPLVDATREVRMGDTVTFLYDRAALDLPFRFDVRDVHTGESVRGYTVLPLDRSKPSPFQSHVRDGPHAYALPADEPAAWCVVRGGYRNAYGDRDDFRPSPPGYVTTVLLERGFAVRVVAARADGSPAAGVELVFEGRRFMTDADGRTSLESDALPSRARIDAPGVWRVVGGDVGDDGAFPRNQAELRLIVERSE